MFERHRAWIDLGRTQDIREHVFESRLVLPGGEHHAQERILADALLLELRLLHGAVVVDENSEPRRHVVAEVPDHAECELLQCHGTSSLFATLCKKSTPATYERKHPEMRSSLDNTHASAILQVYEHQQGSPELLFLCFLD